MFWRRLSERWSGRVKVVDEPFDLVEVCSLFDDLNPDTRVEVVVSTGLGAKAFEATAREVTEGLKKRVSNVSCDYRDVQHQVYADRRIERHFVDVEEGEVVDGKKKGSYFMNLDYIVKNSVFS